MVEVTAIEVKKRIWKVMGGINNWEGERWMERMGEGQDMQGELEADLKHFRSSACFVGLLTSGISQNVLRDLEWEPVATPATVRCLERPLAT